MKLSRNDIINVDITTQSYKKQKIIEGVKLVEIPFFKGEDGTFEEIARFDKGFLKSIPNFEIKQISRSKLLPGAIKGWHLHFNQEDVWYVTPESHLLLGLWDLRKSSSTTDLKMRIVLGAHKSLLVYIPRGVAHGVMNMSNNTGEIVYFVNQQFNPENPDEQRLRWDIIGKDFWKPKKE